MDTKDICIYFDNRKQFPLLKEKYPLARFVFCKKDSLQKDLWQADEKTLLFALANDTLQDATALCRNIAEKEIFVFPYDNGYGTEPILIDAAKPRLNYVECDISHVCNLNCRGCANFSSLSTGQRFYNINQFKRDILSLKELFWGITKIRLLGGEPFLNPELPIYAELVRNVFPDCDLRIVTNGLLIPSLSETMLKRLKDVGCCIEISAYKPTVQMRGEIARRLKNVQIDYFFSIPMRIFFKTIITEPYINGEQAFSNCLFSHCHMIMENKLAPCSYACGIYRLNRRFKTNYPECDFIDLSQPHPDGWEIIDYFTHPHALCRYCSVCPVPMLWQGNRSYSNAKITDWLVKDSFFLRNIAGNAFMIIKKSAETLRKKTQQR